MTKRLRCIISGRVQMVMFRDFAARRGKKLGLSGYAKNLPDDTVEVVAEGDEERLKELLFALKKGPVLAKVEHIESKWSDAIGNYRGFSILF